MGMILFGALLIVAGWKNESLSALARGQAGVAKPTVAAGGTGDFGGTGGAGGGGDFPAAKPAAKPAATHPTRAQGTTIR